MEDKRLPKCVMFGELVGGAGCVGRAGKRVDGVFPGRSQSFQCQRRPVDDCSPGRGGMAQDGGTRGQTFYGKMDRCRESQGWTMECSNMPERDGKIKKASIHDKVAGLTRVSVLGWLVQGFSLMRKWKHTDLSGTGRQKSLRVESLGISRRHTTKQMRKPILVPYWST